MCPRVPWHVLRFRITSVAYRLCVPGEGTHHDASEHSGEYLNATLMEMVDLKQFWLNPLRTAETIRSTGNEPANRSASWNPPRLCFSALLSNISTEGGGGGDPGGSGRRNGNVDLYPGRHPDQHLSLHDGSSSPPGLPFTIEPELQTILLPRFLQDRSACWNPADRYSTRLS